MKIHPIVLILSIIFTGCEIGLTSKDGENIYLDTAEIDEPSSEPGFEPADELDEPSNDPSSDPTTQDNDGDGFSENDGDCNDNDAAVNPSATEAPSDDFDQNCDGREICYQDTDGDGFATETVILSQDIICGNDAQEAQAFAQTTDCDDYDPNINPNATEIMNDGIDQDCDGVDLSSSPADYDSDGYDTNSDCNDYDASIYPGATEIMNDGIDQDCDGSDASSAIDNDGDGYDSSIDCNDYDASINPSATDIPNDGIDQDCNGSDATTSGSCSSTEIVDCNGNCAPASWLGDGFCDDGAFSWGGNLIDFDCSSLNYDNGDCATAVDLDGDGYDDTVDCDDSDATIYPGATEIMNDGIDQDCDGVDSTSSACSSTEIVDCNGNCALSSWLGDGSCDDEVYSYSGNLIDLDCALHNYDDGDCATDNDFDGYDSSTDCDDNDASIYPGATEIMNDGIDQDCDGVDSTSSACSSTEIVDCNGNCALNSWLGDNFCDDGVFSYNGNYIDLDCALHSYDDGDCATDNDFDGYDSSTDCDDSDATIYPGATEIMNDGIDQDCDGVDSTSSGGCSSTEIVDCNGNCALTSWLGDNFCDDGVFSYNGNYIDLDCALHSYDDGDCATDNDFDGYDSSTDCDDSDASIYPGATEIMNDGIDQDCDGVDSTCSSTEIVDCNGNCALSSWLGDNFCDDGVFSYNGNYIDLDCALHSYDDGDCP